MQRSFSLEIGVFSKSLETGSDVSYNIHSLFHFVISN